MPGVIFDLDGTLIDSYDAHFKAWTSMAESLGVELEEAIFQRQFGLKNEPILMELHQMAGLPAPIAVDMARLAEEKETLFRRHLEEGFPDMPGAITLATDLKAAGWRLAIGSSAPRENIRYATERFQTRGLEFDAIACGCDVARGKPEPDVFLLAASKLNLPPEACVVIEDAAAGVEAACRAGMGSVGLVSKGRTTEALASADLIVSCLTTLGAASLAELLKAPV